MQLHILLVPFQYQGKQSVVLQEKRLDTFHLATVNSVKDRQADISSWMVTVYSCDAVQTVGISTEPQFFRSPLQCYRLIKQPCQSFVRIGNVQLVLCCAVRKFRDVIFAH